MEITLNAYHELVSAIEKRMPSHEEAESEMQPLASEETLDQGNFPKVSIVNIGTPSIKVTEALADCPISLTGVFRTIILDRRATPEEVQIHCPENCTPDRGCPYEPTFQEVGKKAHPRIAELWEL